MAHVAQGGGLQQHSVGDDYPYAVVGTIVDGETMYYILNCNTGERWGYDTAHKRGAMWGNCRWAHNVAHGMKLHGQCSGHVLLNPQG